MDHVHRFPQPTKRERESQGERERESQGETEGEGEGASVKGSKGNLSMAQNSKNILQHLLLLQVLSHKCSDASFK